eukprot:690773-Pleurochrysis_carterae.AAC.5
MRYIFAHINGEADDLCDGAHHENYICLFVRKSWQPAVVKVGAGICTEILDHYLYCVKITNILVPVLLIGESAAAPPAKSAGSAPSWQRTRGRAAASTRTRHAESVRCAGLDTKRH